MTIRKDDVVLSALSQRTLSLLLSFVGGFVDAACFYALASVFTSSVTGNIVVAASLVAVGASTDVGGRLLVVPVFACGTGLGAGLAVLLRLTRHARQKPIALVLFLLEAVTLGSLWVGGTLLPAPGPVGRFTDSNDWRVMLLASLASLAMGLQNAATRELFTGFPPTTIMTTVLTVSSSEAVRSAVLALALLLHARTTTTAPDEAGAESDTPRRRRVDAIRADLAASRAQLGTYAVPLLGFLVGAALGATLQRFAGFHSISAPILALAVVWADVAWAEATFRRRRRRRTSAADEAAAGVAGPPPPVEGLTGELVGGAVEEVGGGAAR